MMVMCRFLFSLVVILTCLGTVFLGTKISQAQDITQTDISKLQHQAEEGDVAAQFGLGAMYYYGGKDIPQDYAKAREWWTKSAAQDDAMAQLELGLMYAEGHGVPQDYVQAYKWLKLSAAHGVFSLAEERRDDLAKRMTADQIVEAERLTREETLLVMAVTAAKNIPIEQTSRTVTETVSPNNMQIRLETEALKIQAQHPYVAEIDNLPPKIRDEIWARITDEAVVSLTQRGINTADGTFNSRLALIQEKAALTNKYGPQYTGKKMGVFDDLIPPSETAQNRAARDGFVPLPLEQGKKTGSWEDDFVPIEPAPAIEPSPMANGSEPLSKTFHEYPNLAACEQNARATNQSMELMAAGAGISDLSVNYYGDDEAYFVSQLFYTEKGMRFLATIVCGRDGRAESTTFSME